MPRTPWSEVEALDSKARADREQLDTVREKQGELSQTLAEKAYDELAKRGVTEVAQLMSDGRDVPTKDELEAMDKVNLEAYEAALKHELERPTFVLLVLYSAWLAETLPEDLSTLGTDTARPLPACPPEVRVRILLESGGSDSKTPPEILDLLIRGLEEADGIDLPGLGRLAHGQLTIDVPTLTSFRRINQRRRDAAAG